MRHYTAVAIIRTLWARFRGQPWIYGITTGIVLIRRFEVQGFAVRRVYTK